VILTLSNVIILPVRFMPNSVVNIKIIIVLIFFRDSITAFVFIESKL
jgi:hypothetical protein